MGSRVEGRRCIENFFDEFAGGVLCNSNVCTTFAPVLKMLPRTKVVSRTRENDSVAQLVEQVTLNHWVVSSSLTGVTSQAGIASLEVIPAFFLSVGCGGRRRCALCSSWISPFIYRIYRTFARQTK